MYSYMLGHGPNLVSVCKSVAMLQGGYQVYNFIVSNAEIA